jgi:Flp pilus assembly protein TadG
MLTAFVRKLAVRARQLRPVQLFAESNSGATAVEFSFIAAPFLALLIALFQTGIIFLAGRELDEAVYQASRSILTGQAQTQSPPMTQSQFANQVCLDIHALFNCSNLMVNVQTYPSFSAVSTNAPTLTYGAQGQVTNSWTYNPGGPGDIVVVQVMYQWPLVLGPLDFNLSNLSNGDRLLMSTAVFQNEPYQQQ